MARRREIGTAALAAYALPALPLAVLTLPLYIVVPAFYAEGLGLPIAAVGAVLLAVRLIDAVSDPLAGHLADRTRSRFGRRRVWVALAAPATALTAWMVFVPPADAGLAHLAAWGAALSLASTAALVPYNAWGAELSTSYGGRTRIAVTREAVVLAGTMLALSLQAIMPALGYATTREILVGYAVIVAVGLPLATAAAVMVAPEPVDRSRTRIDFRAGLGHMAANRPFVRLVASFLVNGFANGLPATLFLFYVGRKLEDPGMAGMLLLAYFSCGLAAVPVWFLLARRFSKHRVWCWAMLASVAAFAPAPFLGPGDTWIFAGVCIATGLCVGADLTLPAAIQADVIDVDTAVSGEQRSGLYLAVWGLATKLALALAVGVAFPVLGAAGFDPAGGASTAAGLATLGLLYGGAPILLKLAAIAMMWNFPLDEAAQRGLENRIG